jgi:Response regulator containing a CheY-like receiver domain and an HTH DNA-binding domain
MIRILIADDHIIVRKGLRQILLEEFPSAQIREVSDAEEMIKKIVGGKWDVVISDISMPGRSGLDALHQIKESRPNLPVLILSIHPEDQYAIRVLKAGASGYLNKGLAAEELVKAVRKVLSGKKYISAAVADKLAATLNHNPDKEPHSLLSNREFDVMKLLAAGKSVTEIAESISLSLTTVSTYRFRIMIKMQMKTNADLTRYALDHKLL